ncbi:hypothetical protein AHYW_000219 [Providencia manganoxydans]|uniref:helix-turn-helix domain-containing protein n=1 Tax=Providencia TaxID=586 RepID=UPI0011214E05|nr:helix-turn-helix transcriptional regulator [Providencia stuartii]
MSNIQERKTSINEGAGKVIRFLRKQKNITEGELGELANLSQQQISRYERGINHITLSCLAQILSVLNTSVDDFLYYLSLECGFADTKNIFLPYHMTQNQYKNYSFING